MKTDAPPARNPWLFVPTLYFAEGLPYILINTVAVILYKRMGIDNAQIAFWTSWLYLPWVLKMFWSPTVDVYSTKRAWLLGSSLAMAAAIALAALSLAADHFFVLSLGFFAAAAFISATYDVATDGFYMLALSKEQQALFVGIRTTFYRLAMIFGTGPLVIVAGMLEEASGNVPLSWTITLSAVGVIFALLFLYHRAVLPRPEEAEAAPGRRTIRPDRGGFREVMRSYFGQERVGAIIAFILLYRLGEAMLLKLASPFLLDSREAGGLGLTTAQVGVVYGTVGMLALIAGGIAGGWLIARFGLKRCIWPMALALNLPDLFYVYLAAVQPGVASVYPLVALEQFGYGVGFTAFTVYVMYAAEGRYKTSYFALSTGIMALGMMVPGMMSGAIQRELGYQSFFLLVFFLTIPGMLVIPFLPLREKKASGSR